MHVSLNVGQLMKGLTILYLFIYLFIIPIIFIIS